ncbi:MAG: hypothetical protein SGILL_006688 [Bacillariaceae sp.]
MANGDYNDEADLEKYLQADWFGKHAYFPFKWLLADIPDEVECEDREIIWFCWFEATVKKAMLWLEKTVGVIATAVFLLSPLVAGKGRRIEGLLQSFALPLMLAYLVLLMMQRHIDNSTWFRKIRRLELFNPYENFAGPMLVATFPTNQDVLLLDDFQSEYLASYTRMYDVAHPGNAAWRDSMIRNANGYQYLSDNLKIQLCRSVLQWNRNYRHSRILSKNHENEWAEISGSMALEFAHSQLLRQDNVIVEKAMRQMDYLVSETEFGALRRFSLSRTHTRAMLKTLQRRMLKLPEFDSQINDSKTDTNRPRQIISYLLPKLPHSRTTFATRTTESTGIPPLPKDTPPHQGAWLQVGDMIDGRYHSINNDWRKGVIVSVEAFEETYTVRYVADGEIDPMICRRCVRPFEDYRVGETVEYLKPSRRGREPEWTPAKIRSLLGSDTYELVFFHGDSRSPAGIEVVETKHLRRFMNYDAYDGSQSDQFQPSTTDNAGNKTSTG